MFCYSATGPDEGMQLQQLGSSHCVLVSEVCATSILAVWFCMLVQDILQQDFQWERQLCLLYTASLLDCAFTHSSARLWKCKSTTFDESCANSLAILNDTQHPRAAAVAACASTVRKAPVVRSRQLQMSVMALCRWESTTCCRSAAASLHFCSDSPP